MSFIFGAIATPHEFYIGAKRHHLRARATNGSVGGSDVEAKAEVERSERGVSRASGSEATAYEIFVSVLST